MQCMQRSLWYSLYTTVQYSMYSISFLLPNNLDTSASLSVGMCRTTIGAKSSTVTAARALSPDATVLSTTKKKTEKRIHALSICTHRPSSLK